jgi:hypothetical protein
MSGFYDAGLIQQIATNLFHGYGYNFYRAANQVRADDQRVRELAGSLLFRARSAISKAESGYRRENIPPPTRANPSSGSRRRSMASKARSATSRFPRMIA